MCVGESQTERKRGKERETEHERKEKIQRKREKERKAERAKEHKSKSKREKEIARFVCDFNQAHSAEVSGFRLLGDTCPLHKCPPASNGFNPASTECIIINKVYTFCRVTKSNHNTYVNAHTHTHFLSAPVKWQPARNG